MKIESNLLAISDCLFKNKSNWEFVDDSQKDQFFFIFNRYFAKKYPELSQLLNDKNIDKSVGMDLWFEFFRNKPYPQWFWAKSKKTTKNTNDDDLLIDMQNQLGLNTQEFEFLKVNYPQEIETEINYLKLQKNGNTSKKLVHSKSTK